MNQLPFFIITTSVLQVVTSCSIGACLTWYGSSESITLRCRVDKLKWKVTFFDQLKRAQVYCIEPFPQPLCYSLTKNSTINQNIRTNITVFVINGYIDSTLNGAWKYEHGANIDKALINVTVIKKGNCTTDVILAVIIPILVVISIMFVGCLIRRKRKNRGNRSQSRGNITNVQFIRAANNLVQQDNLAEPNSSDNVNIEESGV